MPICFSKIIEVNIVCLEGITKLSVLKVSRPNRYMLINRTQSPKF